MLVLGLPAPHHSGWGLVKDGKILRAIQEERLNRIKHYPYGVEGPFKPTLGLDYLFKNTGFKLSDCDAVTIPLMPEDPQYHDYNSIEQTIYIFLYGIQRK